MSQDIRTLFDRQEKQLFAHFKKIILAQAEELRFLMALVEQKW
jgi:hypothetical protein